MSDSNQLITAMSEQCADMIVKWGRSGFDQPPPLQPAHLEWMCRQIGRHAGDWPAIKLHRWIGFIQGAMIANRIINLEGAKAMFDKARKAFGEMDCDLLDHLDPDSGFRLEIGGQG